MEADRTRLSDWHRIGEHRLWLYNIVDVVADLMPQKGENAVRRFVQWTRQGASAGSLVAAPSKVLGCLRNIHLPLAAQAQAYPVVRQFPQKRRHLYPRDTDPIVHDALAILLGGIRANHVVMRYPHPGDPSLALQIRKRGAQ